MESKNNYELIVGLEIHVELKTKSKMFCSCSADYFGKAPNTHTCPICLGMPGALPVPNKQAIEWCIKIGLALNCEINLFSKFDRKNYFYPDLAKGYQISQYDLPFCKNGYLEIETGTDSGQAGMTKQKKRIGITRVHMEEDTAKLMHAHQLGIQNQEEVSLIDFNRSGVPLVEIVTEPDIHSATDAKAFLQKLHQIVRYLDVSNADMEKGDMRLEPNISLRILSGTLKNGGDPRIREDDNNKLPPYKVEVKNINSFRFVEKAIEYEMKRQSEILDKGEIPKQETRGWNEDKNVTVSQRSKEKAHDYRYFPEPDIPPIRFSQKEIDEIESKMPELPDEKQERFVKEYSLSEQDAEILTRDREVANYFEQTVKQGVKEPHPDPLLRGEGNKKESVLKGERIDPRKIANWMINKKPDLSKAAPEELLKTIQQATMVATIDKDKLNEIIQQVITNNPKAFSDFKKGKESVIMFLVGQVMRLAKAKIDANLVKKKLQEKLI